MSLFFRGRCLYIIRLYNRVRFNEFESKKNVESQLIYTPLKNEKYNNQIAELLRGSACFISLRKMEECPMLRVVRYHRWSSQGSASWSSWHAEPVRGILSSFFLLVSTFCYSSYPLSPPPSSPFPRSSALSEFAT